MQELQKLDMVLNGKMKQAISTGRPKVQWKPQLEEIINDVPKVNTGCPRVQERTEDDNDSPAANMRLQRACKEQLLCINGKLLQIKRIIVASVNAVMDMKTGQMLEYWHLMEHTKYKEVWNKCRANEFCRLA